jgi:hypothetical protein
MEMEANNKENAGKNGTFRKAHTSFENAFSVRTPDQ